MSLVHPAPIPADCPDASLHDVLAGALQRTFRTRPTARTHVAAFRLGEWERWSTCCPGLLSSAERERAARQRRPGDAAMLRLAYALHRSLLAHWLEVEPGAVPLERDALGCPKVGVAGWHTSLSHAGDRIAIAVSTAGPIGVDVEPDWRAAVMPGLEAMVCTPGEMRAIARLPIPARPMALLQAWVRKEALLKAAGIGMARPMEDTPAPEACWIGLPDGPASNGDALVRIGMLDVLPGCAMAVATADHNGYEAALVSPVRGVDGGRNGPLFAF